jgi:CcmD family protein
MATDWLNLTVMAVTLIVWGGLFIVILRLDKRVKKLERK